MVNVNSSSVFPCEYFSTLFGSPRE